MYYFLNNNIPDVLFTGKSKKLTMSRAFIILQSMME